MTHVHLIGIGGSGLSAIALVLLERGYSVSGSDRQLSPLAQRLQAAGVQVFTGHRPENIQGADLVVRSSAIHDENVEVQAALAAGIPVLKRADYLGQLMAGSRGIAIAGTHGKTTTTAMIAWMLVALGQDPSYIIGGVATNLGRNAHAGQGENFVIEADEYDRMFLGLNPQIAVVTNVEHDHPDCYPTPQDFYQAFRLFVDRLTPDGVLLACGDDPGASRLSKDASASGRQAYSYGIRAVGASTPYAYTAFSLRPNAQGGFTFDATCALPSCVVAFPTTHLRVPGEHNVRNALAALAVADQLGLSLVDAAAALSEFRGAGRRFEVRGEVAGITIIDDYAHHPTEIRVNLAAARARYPQRPIWVVWQPHTYSRTRLLFDDFCAAFSQAGSNGKTTGADHVLVTEIFAAREPAPADGFSARQLVSAMQHPDAYFMPDLDLAVDFLLAHLQPGDVLLVLSAGDADQISTRVLQALQARDLLWEADHLTDIP